MINAKNITIEDISANNINDFDLDTLVKVVNVKIGNVQNYIDTITEKVLKPENLKLYDAFYKACDENRVNDFYDFCDFQFETFQDIIQEETGEKFFDIVHYIGRTSTFYCVSDSLYNCFSWAGKYKIDYEETLHNLLYKIFGDEYNATDINLSDNGFIDISVLRADIEKYEIEEKQIKEELYYFICGQFFTDIKELFKSGLYVYDLIQDFKDNQITAFNDSLEQIEINEEIEKDRNIENLINAINNFKDKPENLENLKSYLTHCYKDFIENQANTPEKLINELLYFSKMR